MPIRIETGSEPIPGYKLLERLGGGGFGEVWKAEAPGGLLKAIKFVHGNLQGVGEEEVRAKQELKALNRVKTVRHPYILSLERFDIIEGQLLIVMELADRNLWDRFQECRGQGLPGIPREELLNYMAETAEALDLMNQEHGLQHLDIKPQNLFLVYNHVKVADFGLVKDLEGVRAAVTGGVTPVYAAPETFDGEVSRFCDQYSLAIVYQELLSGQRPFKGASVQQLIMQHLTGRPNLTPLPPGDRDPIAKALAKKPEDRFASCAELALALRRAGSAPIPKGTPSPTPGLSKAGIQTEARPIGQDDGRRTPSLGPAAASPGRATAAIPRPSLVPTPVQPRPLRVEQDATNQAEEGPPLPPPRPEITSTGVLFPALVIGVGQLGLDVLRQIRRGVAERTGTLEAVPNIRFLYIDTDPESGAAATQEGVGRPLDPGEIIAARLNRASHYLKAAPGRPRLESWFDTKMLYRIPRNLVTTGLRALGRLAFIDNYRLIAQKIRAELEACTESATLSKAAQQTQLGTRTNWPRVYVVTSLAGGTGSGMFLDLAYLVRWHLKQLGYARPDLVGMFLVPEVSKDAARTVPVGNAHAALLELNHFSSPGVTFTARYDDKDGTVCDTEPPFRRCTVLPLPAEGEDSATREIAGFAGDYLARDLVSWLGRTADQERAKLPPPQTDRALLHCQAFGLCRYYWPRRILVQRAARQLCQQLAQSWMATDGEPLRAQIQAWVDEKWAEHELGPDNLIERLKKACEKVVGQPTEAAIAAAIGPVEAGSKPISSLWGKRIPDLSPAVVIDALNRCEQLVGRPEGTVGPRRPAVLVDALPRAGEDLVAPCEKKASTLAEDLIELPDYRFAGAEEAIRLAGARVEQVLKHYESMCQELTSRGDQAYQRIYQHAESLLATGGKRSAAEAAELLEMLNTYPRCRYHALVVRQVIVIYTALRNRLSDQLRDVDFCRQRLDELLHMFEESSGEGRSGEGVPGQRLLPKGCQSVGDAVKQLLSQVTLADVHALDEKVQAMIQQQFMALLHVCQTSGSVLKNLEVAMQREAEPFADERLVETNVVDLFFQRYTRDQQAMDGLARAFDEAAPHVGGARVGRQAEVQVLAAPPGPSEARLRDLARGALPEAKFAAAPSGDDIVLYREWPHVPINVLDQLGPAGEEAYRQMTTVENFTPHTRTDIAEWQPVPAR
jgi:serine/threonine protein kinase